MTRNLLLAAAAAGALCAGAGCRHRCCTTPLAKTPTPFYPPGPPGGNFLGPPTIPPAGVPTTPDAGAGPAFLPPAAPPPVGSLPPAGPAPSSAGIPGPDPLFSSPSPPAGSNFRPAPALAPAPAPAPALAPAPTPPPPASVKPAPEVLLPDPLPGSKSQYPPPAPKGVLGDPLDPRAAPTPEPPLAAKPAPPAPASPADAAPAGFAVVKDGVASGRVPNAASLDALKASGYRSVVYLHATGADVLTLRGEVEKRGLIFTPIEVTPARFTGAMGDFNRAVGTAGSRPAYVADDDGVRAGAVWFAHFRTVDFLNADVARVRARALGYTDDGADATNFQLAIQQYLATR